MKIFGWIADRGGLARIRVGLPLDELARHGHQTVYDQVFDPQYGDADTIVGARIAMPDPSRLWAHCCGMPGGPFCVFETDDDLMNVSSYNKYGPYQFWGNPDVRWRYTANIRIAHRVVTSTDYLANLLQDQFGHPDIVVAPNALPGWMLELPRIPQPGEEGAPAGDKVVVGWAGGSSHNGDWEWYKHPIRRGLQRNIDKVEVHLVGMDYRNDLRMPRGTIRHTPWFESTDTYWREGLDFHIGLAPLRPQGFNRSKSPIKFEEQAARGIPVIASDYGPYHDFVQDGVTGLLVKTKTEWVDAIDHLINDTAVRTRMAAAARKAAVAYTIEECWPLYEKAYTP